MKLVDEKGILSTVLGFDNRKISFIFAANFNQK